MKLYFTFIKHFQNFLLALSIGILLVLPSLIVFYPTLIGANASMNLYNYSHYVLFLVMIIRPLADIFTQAKFIRPLVILRKGMGVLSASVAVSFILAKIMVGPAAFFANYATAAYWSPVNMILFAHLADISAILLIATSNNYSKRLLGANWKRLQRLSYVYFYGSSLFVAYTYGHIDVILSMIIVTVLTLVAFIKNRNRARVAQ